MSLKIAQIGNPVLREKAELLSDSEILKKETQDFIDQLIKTKQTANGAGIAAPQVSVSKRIFLVGVENNPRYPYKPNYPLTVVINPKISFLTENRFQNYEGCLSIPDLRGLVERCPEIRVKGLDRHAQALDFEVRGVTAGTFQHEDDHLNGILFPDLIKDSRTLCTWDEFKERYEGSFREQVLELEERYKASS